VERLNIALDDELGEADADPRSLVELLDGIPGAHERARLGRAQAEAGETIPLEQL
jgi:hypothetical protein